MNYKFVITDGLIKNAKNNFFNNIIIIYGPFQLLNAVETIKEFDLKNILLIVMINKIDKSNEQVENYIEKYNSLFNYVERLKFSNNWKKYIEFYKFIYSLKNNKFEYIAFGTLGSVIKLLVTKLKYNKAILFDDGLETIHTANHLFSQPKLVRFQYFYLGFNRYFKNELICFSMFNHNNANIKYVKNNMSFIKSERKQSLDAKRIAFIGQDFVRTGYVKKQDYFDVLKSVSTKYKNFTIEYYPHRGELDIELDEISSAFNNIKIVRIEMTFELYLSKQESLPSKVISCWSTVLIVMKDMFKQIELESILIQRNKLLKNQVKIIETYEYFQRESINIIKIDGKEANNV